MCEKVKELITRDYLFEHGRRVDSNINHEEYIYRGLRFVYGWCSAGSFGKKESGWVLMKIRKEEE